VLDPRRLVDNAEAVIDAYKAGECSPALVAEMYICLVRMTALVRADLDSLESADDMLDY
jgi:hypothetical protein